MIKAKLKEYQNTEHKIHFFIKNKMTTLFLFGVVSFVVYFLLSYQEGLLSAFKEGIEFSVVVSTGAMLFFHLYKDHLNLKIATHVMSKPYIALFGLGEINRTFLKNCKSYTHNSTLIIENTPNEIVLSKKI